MIVADETVVIMRLSESSHYNNCISKYMIMLFKNNLCILDDSVIERYSLFLNLLIKKKIILIIISKFK